ncbi:putative short-chain dehydrogenase/reductase [Aspergillus steynii IBT 23096]|uniref:Putative short-chain dehydrogenase/reductase n=1 Tax=Aspergillus steynii IBT 23096 TaxID=1392250 RepID=A0A2I2G3A5_9EURO|nr:putative short-chain dehydrogenase/reductase [Aspergillus steynii IBT 23096]PLB47337.1 putative short-chain dehydrogenase/reductase [Aspergillus steynii IBT 23096]
MSTTTTPPRPTALSIIQSENMASRLTDKVVVITGISSGIGIEIVRALATTDATMYLLARDTLKAQHALGAIFNPSRMHLVQVDQSSLSSVRAAGSYILSRTRTVNILINNAGVMAVPERRVTEDGVEMQFGVNHLSHFLLFQVLKDAMLAATEQGEFCSRVVNVSASGHRIHGLNAPGEYGFEKGGYEPWKAYAQSKTANIYMANELERRYGGVGIHATSVHPGLVDTPLGRYLPAEHVEAMLRNEAVMRALKSPEEGAATTVWAAVGREWEGRGGRYLADCREAEWGPDDGDRMSSAYTGHTYCPREEGRLWRDSLEMVGLEDVE